VAPEPCHGRPQLDAIKLPAEGFVYMSDVKEIFVAATLSAGAVLALLKVGERRAMRHRDEVDLRSDQQLGERDEDGQHPGAHQ